MTTSWDELEQLVRARFLDEVVGILRLEVPDADEALITGAVIDAMTSLVQRDSTIPVENVRGYLFQATRRALVHKLRRDRKLIEFRDPEEIPDRAMPDMPLEADQVCERIDADRLLRFLRSVVAMWEADRMRVVIEIYLDGIDQDLELQAQEVRDAIENTTGDLLTVDNVWKLKQRGFARLARQLDEMADAGALVPLRRTRG